MIDESYLKSAALQHRMISWQHVTKIQLQKISENEKKCNDVKKENILFYLYENAWKILDYKA